MGRRFLAALFACALSGVLIAACGAPPIGPGQITPPPPPPPPPVNAQPVIESIRVKGRRQNQPANFADLAESIDVVATVRDDETPPEELEFQWTATVGTFDGTGAKVTWVAPAGAETPLEVTLTLKVIEKYGHPGQAKTFQQDVSSSAALSLHDSATEISDMAEQFLLDFSDSNIGDVSYIMRNFQPGCYGTTEETIDVADNRRRFRILDSRVGRPATTIRFGGICPYLGRPGDACSAVPVYWNSRDLFNGGVGAVTGTDWVVSYYFPDQKRWRLCDSSFDGHRAANMRKFIR